MMLYAIEMPDGKLKMPTQRIEDLQWLIRFSWPYSGGKIVEVVFVKKSDMIKSEKIMLDEIQNHWQMKSFEPMVPLSLVMEIKRRFNDQDMFGKSERDSFIYDAVMHAINYTNYKR